jgi:hypothetical protein
VKKINAHFYSFLKPVLVFFALAFCFACTNEKKTNTTSESGMTLRDISGVRFYEVKRRFSNGLSFNKDGFMQKPTWIIEYKHPDTMLAYSPEKRGMEAFFLQFDHGDVYNFAREFFRIKTISADSVVLQRLEVNARVVVKGEVSDVICTYYTQDYIEKMLKTTVGELQRPSAADTAFIQKLSTASNQLPSSPEKAFAATQPVSFRVNSPNAKVEKLAYTGNQTSRESYSYMYPEYRMEIKKAYKPFNLRFSAVVDNKGNIYVNRIEGVLEADKPARKKLIQGICDVYVKNLFHVVPGTTLGIAHSSEVTLNLVGTP